MEVLRRNTDYALRMMIAIAKQFGNEKLMSARRLTRDCNFSYELGRKLLQKLNKAGLVDSVMGIKGGFALSRKPSEITLMAIISVLQGEVYLNRCLAKDQGCEFEPVCGAHSAFSLIQEQLNDYFRSVTLEKILELEALKRIKNRA